MRHTLLTEEAVRVAAVALGRSHGGGHRVRRRLAKAMVSQRCRTQRVERRELQPHDAGHGRPTLLVLDTAVKGRSRRSSRGGTWLQGPEELIFV